MVALGNVIFMTRLVIQRRFVRCVNVAMYLCCLCLVECCVCVCLVCLHAHVSSCLAWNWFRVFLEWDGFAHPVVCVWSVWRLRCFFSCDFVFSCCGTLHTCSGVWDTTRHGGVVGAVGAMCACTWTPQCQTHHISPCCQSGSSELLEFLSLSREAT